MIPRTIHYCWLSGDPIPAKLQKCMDSWKEKLVGYEFILWNFERFDINSSIWVKEAFEAKKYASAADYIRLFAIYNHGGIYLDMDVEVVKPFDENILQKPIMLAYEDNETKGIEAGCFGAEKEHPYIKRCLTYYNNRQFVLEDILNYTYTLPKIMKSALQDTDVINILSPDYFTAKNAKTGIVTITSNTYCIHHFEGSWLPAPIRFYERARNGSIKIFGYTIGRVFVLPLYIITVLTGYGFKGLRRSINRYLCIKNNNIIYEKAFIMRLPPTRNTHRCKFNIKRTRIYLFIRQLYWRYGVATIRKILPEFHLRGTGNSNSARYCYAVYMRHIVCLFKNGMERLPLRVAEFGPGESLGIGLCAMLAGADEYYGLDVVDHTNKAENLKIFDELITLFKEKSIIPDANEFPGIHIILDDYSFPSGIITDAVLQKTLSEERINAIKYLLTSTTENSYNNMTIKYIVPWENYFGVYPKVDWVFSQAVLEHIDNLSHFYHILKQIILPQGFTSHDIDFRSHDETYTWNGHWAISDKRWKRIRGTRPYLINREPLSTHLQLFKENGFLILECGKYSSSNEEHPSINRNKLTGKFTNLSDEDFDTSTCFIICKI